jgi:hypothetical protein
MTRTPAVRPPGNGRHAYDQLTDSQHLARLRALDALSRMRGHGLSLTAAAHDAGTTPATVRRYAGTALHRDRGRYAASPADRIYRRMVVLSTDGRVEVEVRGSRAASRVGAHWNAVEHYLSTGDTDHLDRFAGTSIGGVPLSTTPGDLEDFFHRGDLDIDGIYPHR